MKIKNISIILGLGFGDEGKGLFTDYLCEKSNKKAIVVRFNGGHQAGHTVWTKDNKSHVFSNFGAGTLQNVPTYWSQYCTFFVNGVLKEWQHIEYTFSETINKNQTFLFVDKMCPVTTHYDILSNRVTENDRNTARHGSCGVGFGATVARHTLTPIKLYAQDLLFEDICRRKLQMIRKYYASKIKDFEEFEHDEEDNRFLENCEKLKILINKNIIKFVNEKEFLGNEIQNNYDEMIFEGAQGILLDMDFGFFPNVTRSNTTSKNALELIEKYFSESLDKTQVYYITRCYQTRHGAGTMANEIEESENTSKNILALQNNEHETNQTHDYQGHFRKGFLNVDWLKYAIFCDKNFSENLPKNLVVTCLDQIKDPNNIPYILENKNELLENKPLFLAYKNLKELLGEKFEQSFYSFGKCDKWEVES